MSDASESPRGDDESRAASAQERHAPTLRERMRPLELLGISGGLAVFAGLVALLVLHPWGAFADQAAHSWLIILVVAGAAFVLSLVVLAMLALGGYEPPKEPPSGVLLPPEDEQRPRGH